MTQPPSNLARFYRGIAGMAAMIAVPVLAIVALVAVLVWWPGAIIALVVLLGIAWLCSRQADIIGREHRG